MLSALLSASDRLVRRVSVAVLAAAALAACDSDRAVSPTPLTKVPTAGNAAATPGTLGFLIIESTHPDLSSISVTGGTYNVITPRGDTLHIVDNGYGDSDATPGRVRLAGLPVGSYTMCPMTAPTGFDFPLTFCVTMYVPTTGGAYAFIANPAPSLWWESIRLYSGEHIGPGVYSVSGFRGLVSFSVADNGPGDLDSRLGYVNVKIGKAGTYTVCELMPPPNSFPATTKCITADVQATRTKWVGFFINQEQAQYLP